jgi:hypothetical protein
MIEEIAPSSQPMLYISTRVADRASSIAATIKASMEQVSAFMRERGIPPAGPPLAVFDDWDGRLVVIEVGYPVMDIPPASDWGRIQAGRTPGGPAARVRSAHGHRPGQGRDTFAACLHAAGLRTTGITWETYPEGDGSFYLHALLVPTSPRRQFDLDQ